MKILIVGGSWNCKLNQDNVSYGKSSSLVNKVADILKQNSGFNIDVYNGGKYERLNELINTAVEYDFVFWWANVDNNLPKIRNVKEVAPKVMLVNSKRDDNDKYTFQELLQKSLALKANLTFKFKKVKDKMFELTIFDPLGCVWYQGVDIKEAVNACINRLIFLSKMTRQGTIKSEENYITPNESDFVDTVRKYANIFQTYMGKDVKTKRFVGNASLRKNFSDSRCGKGMPSFKRNGIVYMSKRNVDKQFITLDNFVPIYLKNKRLMYCGENKPSVDSPVQIRLYDYFPKINYMLHSHCYIKNAPFTNTAIPCGAIEEFDEIIKTLLNEDEKYSQVIKINLLGHGSIVMWNNMKQFHEEIEKNLEYYMRDLPEIMYKNQEVI